MLCKYYKRGFIKIKTDITDNSTNIIIKSAKNYSIIITYWTKNSTGNFTELTRISIFSY